MNPLFDDPIGSASPVSRILRLGLFLCGLFGLFAWLDGLAFGHASLYQLSRRDVDFSLLATCLYVSTYVLCMLGLLVTYCHASRAIRLVGHFLTLSTVTLFLGFKGVNEHGFSYHEASLLWSELPFAGDALREFWGLYLPPLGLSAGLVAGLWAVAGRWMPRFRPLTLALVPVLAAPAAYQVVLSSKAKVYQYPVPYLVPLLGYYAWEHRLLYYGERDAPYLIPSGPPLADHVLVIMDESVRGDLLAVNGAEFDTTPFLDSQAAAIANYGVASSVANTSSSSNIIVQSGLRPDQIPDTGLRSLKNPNVFSYLQRAGFSAFLVDSQIYSDTPTNLMTGFDVERLDGRLNVRRLEAGRPEWEMDLVTLDYVERIQSEHERTFIWLLKTGTHFPYRSKYPPDEAVFEPDDLGGGPVTREKKFNSYLNALRWSVDHYLAVLYERMAGSGRSVLVLYTSDHGQNIDEHERHGELRMRPPHGTVASPPLAEANVPLMLFSPNPGVQARIAARYSPGLRDRVSAWEIFPTVLEIAGYAYPDVRRHYYLSLFDGRSTREPRIFVSGNYFGIRGGFYEHGRENAPFFRNAFAPEAGGVER